jgi:hypothetical protein
MYCILCGTLLHADSQCGLVCRACKQERETKNTRGTVIQPSDERSLDNTRCSHSKSRTPQRATQLCLGARSWLAYLDRSNRDQPAEATISGGCL